jgi:hypothetical protein
VRRASVPSIRHRDSFQTPSTRYRQLQRVRLALDDRDGDGLLRWQIADQAQEAFDAVQLPVAHIDLDRDARWQAWQGLIASQASLNWSRWRRRVGAFVRSRHGRGILSGRAGCGTDALRSTIGRSRSPKSAASSSRVV